MNKNIIFFDIDNTIIDAKTHEIPESTKEALKMAKSKGNLSIINTGRAISEITPDLRELGFDGYICGCGTYIEFNNEVLFHNSLGQALCKQIINDMNTFKLDGVLEGQHDTYFDKIENIRNEYVLKIMQHHKSKGLYKGTTWYKENIDFDKFVVFCNEDSSFDKFYEKYKDTLTFIKAFNNCYEIIPANCSKATGIEFLIKYLNIDKKNTYAIGDSMNDLPMLNYVNNSIAMGNSTKSLFQNVSYITTDVDKDGIYNALNHYKLI